MGKAIEVVKTNKQLTTNYDYSKIFIWNNRYESDNYNNDGYDDVTLLAGTVMGMVSATGLIVPLKSGASDGSQYPVGVLAQDYTVVAGDTISLRYCIAGDVDQTSLVFDGTDTLATLVDGRRLKQRIEGDTVGIILKSVSELSNFDN